jgi:hypothetical protein
MARLNDEGPYKVGNVYLTTNLGNALDVKRAKRRMPDDERIARQEKRGRWTKKHHDYDLASHIAYKAHCDPEKFVAE